MNRVVLFPITIFVFLFSIFCLAHAGPGFSDSLSNAAINRTNRAVVYDGRYIPIKYPGGDVPKDIGVCTDVVIRSYRALGIDLQQKVHEDMVENFDLYPRLWGLKKTDSNIDHRRVPNLQVFFKLHGVALTVTHNAVDFKAGDIVTWSLSEVRFLPHIGIVTDQKSSDGKRPLIVHNIGRGPKLEDMLFDFKITGHYRYPVQ